MSLLNILSDESKWTKGVCSRDKDGTPLYQPNSGVAVCWCLVGAIHQLGYNNAVTIDFSSKLIAGLPEGFYGLSQFNDHPETTYQDVVNLIKKAGV